MAKKKKTQLKPIARGFATTSMPKKAVQGPNLLDLQKTVPGTHSGSTETSTEVDKGKQRDSIQADHLSALSIEDRALQSFMEKLQDKTEKEITRAIKSIEVDRRFAQTLPRMDIDPLLRNRIIATALSPLEPEAPKILRILEEAEENVLAQLGITYGVLRRLGFKEDRVRQCLKSIKGVELDEALEWLYLHCEEHELVTSLAEIQDSKGIKTTVGGIIQSDFQSTPSATTISDSGAPSTPSSPAPHASEQAKITILDIPADIKSHILSTYGNDTISGDGDFYEPDPTLLYICFKLQRDELASGKKSQVIARQLRQIDQKLIDISKDYLFSEKQAATIYQKERNNFMKRRLQERLSSPPSNYQFQQDVAPKIQAGLPIPTEPKMSANLLDDDDSDNSESTGLLGFLEDVNPNEITTKGITYRLRDMTIPKHWSGPMPNTLLHDFVNKMDKYAAISYTAISGRSRANRASISIAWHGNRRNSWSMDDVACHSSAQADQYIATIALHSLTYPLTDGFISSLPTSTSSATSFRLLPASYRDLWDELEVVRKQRGNALNCLVWAELRDIVMDKIQRDSERTDKQTRQAPLQRPLDNAQTGAESEAILDSMAQNFQTRRATSAYRKMLVNRSELPIAQYRDRIVNILEHKQVLVLSGETGCGKSTQVPAFLLEDHLSHGKPCKIYCTEPRRISAISLAQRVSYELCDPPNSVGTMNSLVGYSIRLESNITRNTRLAFVTNGIALRMLENGSGQGGKGTAFDDITHLIIDEVHERTIESDFLLIVLKSLVTERPDLKVILMSATLDAEKISNYFDNCETLHVLGRTFPVDVQFLEDAVEFTKWSISEDSPYARRRHDRYYKGRNRPEWTDDAPTIDDDDDDSSSDAPSTSFRLEKRYSPATIATLNTIDERLIPYDLIIRLLETICFQNNAYHSFSRAILVFMPGLGEIRRLNDMLAEHGRFGSDEFRVYPLHSTLSNESQGAIFDLPPSGVRKIVVATNIAETGITIPDITCVIDTGKHREMRFDEKRQISRLAEMFIAKSNAAQRRGRAGRVQHGLCFHLFTKIRHDTQMADSPLPEMMRLSLSDLALRIKIMKVKLGNSIEDVLSRALDPPASVNIQRAVSMLVEVRALSSNEEITPMGKLLSKLPTDVHLGKFLLIATIFRCLDPALTIAATLNSKSPFLIPLGLEQEADRAKNSFRTENSDFLTIHNAFSSWRRACANTNFARKFCRANFLSHQNLQQIEDLRQQFLGYLVDSSFVRVDKSFVRELSRARFSRNRTQFVTPPPELDVNSQNLILNAALTAGLYPKMLSLDRKNAHLHTIANNQHAFLHPSSVNFGRNLLEFGVNHLAYFTLMHSKKLYAWETGPVDDLAMILLCGECDFKLASNMAFIDRRLKFTSSPKTNIALKILRERLANLMSLQFQGKTLTDSQAKWMEIGILALSHAKLKDEKDDIRLIAK
ncbi:P-loop containing nucleoside triphosphate hydrolase protein [Pholiota conissans]|uniref:RNA helicase n=1 Tax=Pholiota conissans TaxID=109636 RepID=A0A9P6CV50_9AGAR|nr:P-loop containing nucleoside triphosphate hydrolase protein [Pholiota conissans]